MQSKLARPVKNAHCAESGRAPGPLLMLLEARAPWEAAALAVAAPWLSRLPAGDGHPVLVFPGLTASDFSTLPLRRFLRQRGHWTHAWKQGFNLGPRHGVLHECRNRLRHLAERHGQRVSLIGWSLGGVYARELAKEMPDLVRCVITLGSPFAGHPRHTNAWRVYRWFSGQADHDEALRAQLREAPPVPTTSIFSRTDGVVAWHCSVNDALPHTENIEITAASHIGMGINPLALYVVADRLREDPKTWQRFDVSGRRRWFFRHAQPSRA